MVAARPVVVCELLWYINSQFTKVSKSDISSVLNSFYTNDEVITAKKLLFDFVDAMKEDYIPTYTERKGVNKQRANVDDIIGLFALLDVHKVELPRYAVVDMSRIPSSIDRNADSSVVTVLISIVNDLKQQVATLVDKVEALSTRAVASGPELANSSSVTLLPSVNSDGSSGMVFIPPSTSVISKSWADQP